MVVVQGIAAINWEFIFGMPSNGMKSGGIWPAIVGTLILTFTTAVISIPLGVGGAIYLSEYARDTKLTRSIRLALVNLAGIPSVVYGLFGLGMFVIFLGFGTSILAGALTLAIMTLPVMISAAEEALRAVPMEFRTVSASLGGTRWQFFGFFAHTSQRSGVWDADREVGSYRRRSTGGSAAIGYRFADRTSISLGLRSRYSGASTHPAPSVPSAGPSARAWSTRAGRPSGSFPRSTPC